MSSDLQKYTSAELSVSKIDELISKKMTFQVVGLSDISRIVEAVEGCIEKKG